MNSSLWLVLFSLKFVKIIEFRNGTYLVHDYFLQFSMILRHIALQFLNAVRFSMVLYLFYLLNAYLCTFLTYKHCSFYNGLHLVLGLVVFLVFEMVEFAVFRIHSVKCSTTIFRITEFNSVIWNIGLDSNLQNIFQLAFWNIRIENLRSLQFHS